MVAASSTPTGIPTIHSPVAALAACACIIRPPVEAASPPGPVRPEALGDIVSSADALDATPEANLLEPIIPTHQQQRGPQGRSPLRAQAYAATSDEVQRVRQRLGVHGRWLGGVVHLAVPIASVSLPGNRSQGTACLSLLAMNARSKVGLSPSRNPGGVANIFPRFSVPWELDPHPPSLFNSRCHGDRARREPICSSIFLAAGRGAKSLSTDCLSMLMQ